MVATDLAAPGEAERLVEGRPDLIFHLAAVVSGEAEADFEEGYRVNLDGTRALLEAVRAAHRRRLPSSFGLHVLDCCLRRAAANPIPRTFRRRRSLATAPRRRSGSCCWPTTPARFLDGIGIRLPTICIRPRTPNKAASGFFSSILREPLVGQEAVLPVPETVRHWHASPRSAVEFLVRAATLDGQQVGPRPDAVYARPQCHRGRARSRRCAGWQESRLSG